MWDGFLLQNKQNKIRMTRRKLVFPIVCLTWLLGLAASQQADVSEQLLSEIFTKEPAVDVSRSGTEENVSEFRI